MNPKKQKNEKYKWYLTSIRPVFIQKGLFSDTTENYVSPVEPEPFSEVTIKIRAARNNVDECYLVAKDKTYEMELVDADKWYEFYSATVQLTDEEFDYHFRIVAGRIECVYDAAGAHPGEQVELPFHIVPGFHTPEWAKGAVMYQIFTERFCNGDSSNDVVDDEYYYVGGHVKRIAEWDQVPAPDDTKEFYGGDLQGVIDKLDYLKMLGIDAIYFNPLFVSPSNHKYDIQDYEHIDPHFGRIVKDGGDVLAPGDNDNKNATKYQIRVTSPENLEASDALFCELVRKAHERGIKVILDGVFNHCGSFNKWLDRERIYEDSEVYEKGAYVSKDSPYNTFFDFKNPNEWPYNKSYDGWWGFDTLPKLNYEASQALYYKVIEIGKKWVSPPFNVDGWRLDVAADLGHSPEFNHEFFKRFRKEVKEANPDALILAEHYGDPKYWLNGKEWDSVMNYDAFMEPVTWYLTGMQKHSDDFRGDLFGNSDAFFKTMTYAGNKLCNASKQVAMNQLSNHDHSRFLTRTNQKVGRTGSLGYQAADEGVDKAVMRLAVMMQMTWMGAPTIYYGDEAGMTGFTDPDNRRTYPWGHEDKELIGFHREMIRIRKENPELISGSFMKLSSEGFALSYARFTRDSSVIVVINRDTVERTLEIPVWATGVLKVHELEKLIKTTRDGFSTDRFISQTDGGRYKVTLPPVSGLVVRTKRD